MKRSEYSNVRKMGANAEDSYLAIRAPYNLMLYVLLFIFNSTYQSHSVVFANRSNSLLDEYLFEINLFLQ